jgi:septal ring factor EnvC (AmiA/AmiB activator)
MIVVKCIIETYGIIAMTTKQNKPRSELLEIKTFISGRFDELKADIASVTNEVGQIKIQTTELDKKLAVIETKIDSAEKRISNVENSVTKIPEITEKFGELKNWRQTAFVIIAAVVSAFLGWIARGGKV